MVNTYQVMCPAYSSLPEIDIGTAITRLVSYCRASDWRGHDPYDALNSPIFRHLPFLDHRLPRLVFTQALKRSPVNFRRLLRIPTTQNPKAIALFLSAFVMLKRAEGISEKGDIDFFVDRLCDLKSPGANYCCWGYSFPWQTRTIVVPSRAPNLVCTCFVANALLDAFDQLHDPRCLHMALSAAEYVLDELYWSEGGAAGFSYPMPSLRGQVHNANLLGAALLCRIFTHIKDERFLHAALQVARYSSGQQRPDGSWYYGEAKSQRWIDNFHTGYNLCALHAISRYAATAEFDASLKHGFEFYRNHFFWDDGAVGYFHDRKYPIDVHCVAQSIITLVTLRELDPRGNLELARSVLQWALTHLWSDQGFFYYRMLRSRTIRTSYMRWSQAWMLLAMVALLNASRYEDGEELDSVCGATYAEGG